MHIKSKFASWIGGLREQASSIHPRARVIGITDFYNEELEEIGDEHSCWRLRGERDEAFRHRLALTVQDKILHLEATLNRLLKKSKCEE